MNTKVKAADEVVDATERTSIYVYEAPVRLWHWVNAFCILILCVTGYFIGKPLPAMAGDATYDFYFGELRQWHFATGQILAVGFLVRIYWAFVGNEHARQIFFIPFWKPTWWKEVVFEAKWYGFIEEEPKKYVGHNPLAHFMMFFFFTLTTIFMICSGFALFGEGAQAGHWSHEWFGWMYDIFPNTMDLHTFHRLGMWVIIVFVILHIYAAVREDIMSRQSIISTMVSGERMFKDNRDD